MLPSSFVADIRQLVASARQSAYAAVSMVMLDTYWKIGRRIVEEEQNGQYRAGYGTRLIETLSAALTADFGKGYSERNLWKYKQFYLLFRSPAILPTVSAELPDFPKHLPLLPWSHYERITKHTARRGVTMSVRNSARSVTPLAGLCHILRHPPPAAAGGYGWLRPFQGASVVNYGGAK